MGKVTVRKRGNYWSWRFEGATVDGKRQQPTKSGYRTKKEAEIAGNQAYNEYFNSGLVFEPTELSVADYLDYWFDHDVKVNLAYNTQLGYFSIIENHLKPAFGKYKLKALQPAVIQEFADKLKFNGLSKSTIQGILAVLGGAYDYAIEPCNFVKENPADRVRMPKVDRKKRERIILTDEDWERILERFPFGNRFHIMLVIGYHTGLRISEVCALTWDDIDFENDTIDINKQTVKRNFNFDVRKTYKLTGKKEKRSEWYFQKTKSAASEDIIKMGPTLKAALQKEKARQAQQELVYGEFWTEHRLKAEPDEKNNIIYRIIPVQKCVDSNLPKVRLVCIDEDGAFTSSDSFKYASRVIHYEMGLAFDFHALRHTHGTLLAESGVNPKAIQKRLRHARITTTLDTYIHATEKLQDQAVEQWEECLRGQK
jgi:integrase